MIYVCVCLCVIVWCDNGQVDESGGFREVGDEWTVGFAKDEMRIR